MPPYARFPKRLLPIAVVGFLLDLLVIAFIYRRSLFARDNELRPQFGEPRVVADALSRRGVEGESPSNAAGHRWPKRKSIVVVLGTVVLFFTGLPLELTALGAAAFLLLGRTRSGRIYREIDWSLLVMFTSLFVVVRAFGTRVVACSGIDGRSCLVRHPVDLLSLVSAGHRTL